MGDDRDENLVAHTVHTVRRRERGCRAGVTAGGTAQAHAITLTLGKVFLFLFVTLEPFNVLGPFASMTRGRDNVIKRRLAMQGSSIAAIAVVVAATVGAMISSPRRCCWWLVSGRTGKILVRLVYPQG